MKTFWKRDVNLASNHKDKEDEAPVMTETRIEEDRASLGDKDLIQIIDVGTSQ